MCEYANESKFAGVSKNMAECLIRDFFTCACISIMPSSDGGHFLRNSF